MQVNFGVHFFTCLVTQVCLSREAILFLKGQLISKAKCQNLHSSKNEFVFTTMQRVFVCFLEEIEDTKKTFRNYLTFKYPNVLT